MNKIEPGDRVLFEKRIFIVEDVWFDGQEQRAMIVNRRGQTYSVTLVSLTKMDKQIG